MGEIADEAATNVGGGQDTASPDGNATILRPAVIGITPRGSGPPPDVAQHYLELVGLKPTQGTTP